MPNLVVEDKTPVMSVIRITGTGFTSPSSAASFLLESGCEPSTHEITEIERGYWLAAGVMAVYLANGR